MSADQGRDQSDADAGSGVLAAEALRHGGGGRDAGRGPAVSGGHREYMPT